MYAGLYYAAAPYGYFLQPSQAAAGQSTPGTPIVLSTHDEAIVLTTKASAVTLDTSTGVISFVN